MNYISKRYNILTFMNQRERISISYDTLGTIFERKLQRNRCIKYLLKSSNRLSEYYFLTKGLEKILFHYNKMDYDPNSA